MDNYKARMVFSNNLIEHYYFKDFIRVRGNNEPRAYDRKLSLSASVSRAKSKLRRLAYANAFQFYDNYKNVIRPKMITITYKDNIQDLNRANYEFNLFMKRLKDNAVIRLGGDKKLDLAYIGVPEFQERGAVHYHTLFFNLPFIAAGRDAIRKIWKSGFQVKINAYDDIHQVAGYVTKYMSKQNDDERFYRKKRYFPSRNLKLPLYTDDVTIHQDVLLRLNNAGIIKRNDAHGDNFMYTAYVLKEPLYMFDFQKKLLHNYVS